MLHPIELERRVSVAGVHPPLLAKEWSSVVLLLPFGDVVDRAKRVHLANIEYLDTDGYRAILFSVTELGSRRTFSALCITTGSVTSWFGVDMVRGVLNLHSHATDLVVPSRDFLSAGATSGGTWEVTSRLTSSWVLPSPTGLPFGTWFSFDKPAEGSLWRVLNISSKNENRIPIFGSFSLAYFTQWSRRPSRIRSLVEQIPLSGEPPTSDNALKTQRELFSALDEFGVDLPEEEVLAVPGLSPQNRTDLSARWPDILHASGWTIGCDFKAYQTEIDYWWQMRSQRSAFLGCGPHPGHSSYKDRIDVHLGRNRTDFVIYSFVDNAWSEVGKNPPLLGIGLPRPDFVERAGGVLAAVAEGTAEFGLSDGQSLRFFSVAHERANGVRSQFWLAFDGEENGKFFLECEFADIPQHSLQLIDYLTFTRGAAEQVGAALFFPGARKLRPSAGKSLRLNQNPGAKLISQLAVGYEPFRRES